MLNLLKVSTIGNSYLSNGFTNKVEYFSPDSETWQLAGDYPVHIFGASAVAISDHELLSCGGNNHDMLTIHLTYFNFKPWYVKLNKV